MSIARVLRLGDFCRTGSGSTPSRSELARYYDGGTIPWVKSGELREGVIFETEEHVTDVALKETSVKLVPKGAILLAMYGATVGRLALLGIEATTNQAVCHIVPDPAIADTRYLFHALSSQVPSIIAMGVGGAQPNISQGVVKNLKVWLPPLPEQRRIAAILDKADVLRAKRREALSQLDNLAESVFVEVFEDVLTTAERTPLGALVEEFRYGTSNKSGASGYPTLRIPNVVGGAIDLNELKTVSVDAAEFARLRLIDGDLLFVRTNGNQDYVGRSSVFSKSKVSASGFDTDAFIYASYLIRARLKGNQILPTVLQFYLSTAEGRRELRSYSKTSAGQFNINTEGLGALSIPNFPMPLQKDFVERLDAIERQRSALMASAAELDSLFSSLQHRAFLGKL